MLPKEAPAWQERGGASGFVGASLVKAIDVFPWVDFHRGFLQKPL